MATGTQAQTGVEPSILEAAQRGDRAAQGQIFLAHRDRVAQQILRMTGDAGTVDDLVQEVFISAFAALPRFRGDARLATWLYTIATNKVRNWWDSGRRRKRRETVAGRTPIEPIVTPEESLETVRHRERLYEALGTLAHPLREAFVARAIESRSLQETSELLGVPVSTVSYRTRRAEKLLCDALGIAWVGDRKRGKK